MNHKPNILIVDDREKNLIALEALLEQCKGKECDAVIHKASSGNEALSLLLKHDFAIVLLDVQMPGMDGFEVAELMRANVHTRHIPIIFVTAISKEQKYVFKGYEVGAVDYLPKPIEPVMLYGKIKVFIDLWRQRRELDLALAEKEKLAEELRQQAQFDTLTGLPNRRLFNDRLQQAIWACERSKTLGALMFLDLDRFKWVNDTLGHEAGDQLLIQVAKRLLSSVRKTDTVARFGGDEFTVVLQNASDQSVAESTASKIIAELATPFELSMQEVSISASVGITLFPLDALGQEQLLKNADAAMYRAKESGKNCFHFHQKD